MRINNFGVYFGYYDPEEEHDYDPETALISTDEMSRFLKGKESLMVALDNALCNWRGIGPKANVNIIRASINISINNPPVLHFPGHNPPIPNLSEISVVVDTDYDGEGVVVKGMGGGILEDFSDKYQDDITFRQLNRMINQVLKRKEKIQ